MVLVELIYLVVVPCPVPNIFLRLQTPYLQRIKSSRTCCSPQAAQGLVMDCWSTLLDLLEKGSATLEAGLLVASAFGKLTSSFPFLFFICSQSFVSELVLASLFVV
jgi:hypothetical protein